MSILVAVVSDLIWTGARPTNFGKDATIRVAPAFPGRVAPCKGERLPPAIAIQSLSKVYASGFRALDHVDL
ncbi:MAG: hypothetical protein ACTHKB_14520, partial [Burkholderiaceae bacterium]